MNPEPRKRKVGLIGMIGLAVSALVAIVALAVVPGSSPDTHTPEVTQLDGSVEQADPDEEALNYRYGCRKATGCQREPWNTVQPGQYSGFRLTPIAVGVHRCAPRAYTGFSGCARNITPGGRWGAGVWRSSGGQPYMTDAAGKPLPF